MFFGTHWKAVYLWYELMLKYCLYSQKHVCKGNNLCSCPKSFAHQEKPAKANHIIFFSDEKFFIRISQINSQNNRYQCSYLLDLMMEKSAQPGKGGGCTPTPLSTNKYKVVV
jgi:hypothetical protein